jgi:hypothetical protein
MAELSIKTESNPQEREREYYGNYVYGSSLQHYECAKRSLGAPNGTW